MSSEGGGKWGDCENDGEFQSMSHAAETAEQRVVGQFRGIYTSHGQE